MSLRRLVIEYTCDECSKPYVLSLADQYLGKALVGRYCAEHREKRMRAWETAEARNHDITLAYHRGQWLINSGIPPYYREKGFEGFDAKDMKELVADLKEYSENFPVEKKPASVRSLVIAARNNGVGKTHLACGILKNIIGRFTEIGREKCPYQFWPVSRVKQRVEDARRFSNEENTQDVFRDFATMWLLVLDDLGKEKLVGADAAFVYETYYTILNERYNAGLPVILTSNLGMEPWGKGEMGLEDLIGKAGCSRLMEMTGGKQHVVVGQDRR